jgi:hypothetical protein
MKLRWTSLSVLLLACSDHRGEVDQPCRPDGSCVSARLECVSVTFEFDLSSYSKAICMVKAK